MGLEPIEVSLGNNVCYNFTVFCGNSEPNKNVTAKIFQRIKVDFHMLNIAHRGASGAEPENTLSSFQKAIDLNVDMIEMDIRVCKSGEAIVIHDETVNRTTGGRGKVPNKDLDRIKMLDAGSG